MKTIRTWTVFLCSSAFFFGVADHCRAETLSDTRLPTVRQIEGAKDGRKGKGNVIKVGDWDLQLGSDFGLPLPGVPDEIISTDEFDAHVRALREHNRALIQSLKIDVDAVNQYPAVINSPTP